MTSGFESAINEIMADLDKQRDELVRLSRTVTEVTGDARSKRRQVSATVDGRGEIVELKFHGSGYRNLPPTELASIIVDTIREAKAAAQAQMWEQLGDVLPQGAEIADVVAGTHDWSESIGEAMTLPQPLLDLLRTPPTDLLSRTIGNPGGGAETGDGADTRVGGARAPDAGNRKAAGDAGDARGGGPPAQSGGGRTAEGESSG